MNNSQPVKKYIELVLLKVKEADISAQSRPEEIKPLFKKTLSLNNPYWILNPDSDRLTKLGLIFKPQQAYIQKGKPIYTSLSFEDSEIVIALEEQYARTLDNTFKVPYQFMLNSWDDFANTLCDIFSKASEWANGNRN